MNELLTCEGLTKSYQKGTNALDDIELHIGFGRIVGLLGPNGSGKTTLIKLANGLLVPSSGTVTIDGHTPGPETKGLISYLPERTYLSGWMNVVQLLDFFGDFYPDFDRDAAEHMLSALDVSPRLRIKQMSKGTREKVQLILVMSRRARLYLLDEPIGGVDPATRDYIIHTILTNYNENASLVISTHLIADVENVLDDVIFINKGRVLLQQSVDQIRQEKGCSVDELFREVFRYAEIRVPGHRAHHAAGIRPAAGDGRRHQRHRLPDGPLSREHGPVHFPDAVYDAVRLHHLRRAAADPGADGVPVL